MMYQSFDGWMDAVDQLVQGRTGLSVYDLPDCLFRDWYEEGVKPPNAASRAIRNAKDEE